MFSITIKSTNPVSKYKKFMPVALLIAAGNTIPAVDAPRTCPVESLIVYRPKMVTSTPPSVSL